MASRAPRAQAQAEEPAPERAGPILAHAASAAPGEGRWEVLACREDGADALALQVQRLRAGSAWSPGEPDDASWHPDGPSWVVKTEIPQACRSPSWQPIRGCRLSLHTHLRSCTRVAPWEEDA